MNKQLGALSGLAMLLIILNHSIHVGMVAPQALGYSPVTGGGRYLLSTFQALGSFAVPIFLFISGSFVAYAVRGRGISLQFIRASLQHILLPYLLWSILFYGVIYLRDGKHDSLVGYLHHLLVGYPFHFVPLLVFFYLLSPLLLPWARRSPWTLVVLVATYQLFLLNLREPGLLGFTLPAGARWLAPPILRNTLADWALYFPLGLLFSLHAAAIRPWVQRFRWLFVVATGALFGIGLLDGFSLLEAPLARHLCPLALLPVVPLIQREAIPFVRQLEKVGRRAYGLYLTHLLVLYVAIMGIQLLAGWLFSYPLLLHPLLFLLALQLPLWAMNWMARPPTPRVYRYVFG